MTARTYLGRGDDGRWRIRCTECDGNRRLYYLGDGLEPCKTCRGKGRLATTEDPRPGDTVHDLRELWA